MQQTPHTQDQMDKAKRRMKAALSQILISLVIAGIGGILIWLGKGSVNTSLLHAGMFLVGFLMVIMGLFGVQSAFNIVTEGRQLTMPHERVHWWCPHCGHDLDTWKDMPDPGEVAPCPSCSQPVTRRRW